MVTAMDFSWVEYAVLFVTIGFAGFVDSIAGGGGLITIPCYIALGVPETLILGTNKCVSTMGTSMAVWRYITQSKINWQLIKWGGLAAFFGALIGANAAKYLDRNSMIYVLIAVIPLSFWASQKATKKLKTAENLVISLNGPVLIKIMMIGFVIGGYDGFFGPGTGSFFLIALVYFLGFDFGKASTHGRLLNYASNIAAFAYFGSQSKILWEVAIVAIIASMIGNLMGSHLVVKKQGLVVRPVFYGVLLLLIIKCLHSMFAYS